MNIDKFDSELSEFMEQKIRLTVALKEIVKDKSYSLDDRWELFICSELGYHQDDCLDLECFDLDSFYAKIGYDRYHTYTVDDLLSDIACYGINLKISDREKEEQLNEIKEELLDKFIYSFNYDW